ncbi:hypothetical protein MBRA_15640 [Mycobacterium branderi]|uniref:MarR family transcriptional regulator n=1 Tax=Mycobacterium branderi TaxID=43348 RepID=A0ABN6B3C1_9MYCO|nr:hypothetical protein MBRA_15640 [Mycobacterium branderi]
MGGPPGWTGRRSAWTGGNEKNSPAGRAAIEKAAPRHVEDVRRNFIDLLTPAELDMLAALNERILHHLAETTTSRADDEPS